MSSDQYDKNWSQLSDSEARYYQTDYNKQSDYLINRGNLCAKILTNWLYGLSTVGLTGVYVLLEKHILIKNAWAWIYPTIFAISLLLCILSTAFEYWRTKFNLTSLTHAYLYFVDGHINQEDYINQPDEYSFWLSIMVTVLRIAGYFFLFLGAAVVIWGSYTKI